VKFATFQTAKAAGAVLAHTVHLSSGVLKKGRVLTDADVAALSADGITSVMAARLGPDDVSEDEAARIIAAAICGDHVQTTKPFTGRTNLQALAAGVAVIDRDRLIALNDLEEGLTVATVPPFETVRAGQLVATVKIIPFALSRSVVEGAEALLRKSARLISVAPFAARTAGLILTRVSGMKESLLAKRTNVIRERLEGMGSSLGASEVVAHEPSAVCDAIKRQKAAGHDPILVFGASAIVDRGDVIPQAIINAGGEVVHLGMPVDPGNLLLVGRLNDADVIGVPSCASSPKLNGFDWVLARRLAGLPVGRAEIVAMAPGGLLTEIPTRPQPRGG
jgi:molybdenum cofactor cytidylyltransferase